MTVALRRAWKRSGRLYREIRLFAFALRSPHHPVFAHVVAIRRCNLACTYCSEFDDHSQPVPIAEMLARIDRLARRWNEPAIRTFTRSQLRIQIQNHDPASTASSSHSFVNRGLQLSYDF